MSRAVKASISAVITIGVLLTSGSVKASAGRPPQSPMNAPPPTTEPVDQDDDGEFSREVDGGYSDRPGTDGSSGSGSGGGGGGSSSPVPCVWFAPPATEATADSLNELFGVVEVILASLAPNVTLDVEFYVEGGSLRRWNGVGGRFEEFQVADCTRATEPSVATGDVRWAEVTDPSPAVLIPALRLVVTGRIGLPESQISPPAEAPVNLGLWLAVEDSGPIVVAGQLGPLWARGTATLTSTTFDPGNGSGSITCAGAGTPITDPDTVGEGPCGYTYRSLGDVRDDDLDITIAATWTIVWETSDGNGSADPPETLTRTTGVPYDVYEIQTVGGT